MTSRASRRDNARIIAASDICALCNQPVDKTVKTPHPMSPEVDHKVPLALGGPDTRANKQLTHRKCNRAKWHRLELPGVKRSGTLA